MFDKDLIKKALTTVIELRTAELKSLQEFNNFSEEDNNEYNALTDDYRKQLADLDSSDYVSKNDYLRLAADFDNYKKRNAKTEQLVREKTEEDTTLHFLGVYDNLEMLLANLDNKNTGFSIIVKALEQMLNDHGFRKISCSRGDKFNVDTMEAISVRDIAENENYKPDDVVEIFQSGWTHNEKMIRPVKVIVGK